MPGHTEVVTSENMARLDNVHIRAQLNSPELLETGNALFKSPKTKYVATIKDTALDVEKNAKQRPVAGEEAEENKDLGSYFLNSI